MKKTFIILNGKTLRIIERDSMAAAVTSAVNTCDHSHEIIVREIDYNLFTDHKREYINQPTATPC
jgi:hypothetical protein